MMLTEAELTACHLYTAWRRLRDELCNRGRLTRDQRIAWQRAQAAMDHGRVLTPAELEQVCAAADTTDFAF